MTKLVAIVSDLHAGSTSGIMPPSFHIKEGNEIGLNEPQKWIWECWNDCWKWFYDLAGMDEWSLVANGDLIDGFHHGTIEVFSIDESEHGIAAYHVLKDPALKADSVYITEGTNSHTKGMEHSVAYQLKAKGANVVMPKGSGGAWKSLDIQFNKTYCKFDHHISSSKRRYLTGTKLTAEFGDMVMRKAMANQKVPRVVVRSHCHEYDLHENGYGLILTTPAWQLDTRFVRQVVPNALPTVGLVVLDFRDSEEGELPIVRRRLHTIKQPTITKG